MLNTTTLNFPFPPAGATNVLIETTVAGVTTAVLRPVAPAPPVPAPLDLGPLPSGAVLAVSLRWFGADGREITPATADTITLPVGGDSALTYTITTGPSPTPVQPA